MLELPLYFKDDITARDTNLFPVLYIGGTIKKYFSTVHWQLTESSVTVPQNTIPILKNLPFLKEKLNLVRRKYAISACEISLSNMPYEGVRFSELSQDSSLINIECRIFWVSQNVDKIGFLDIEIPDNPNYVAENPSIAFQAYYGKIQR